MTKIKTKEQAIEAVEKGNLQISCQSKVEATEVCKSFKKYINDFELPKNRMFAFNPFKNRCEFFFKHELSMPTLTARTFISLPSEEVKKEKSLSGGWCVKNDGSDEFKDVMKFAFEKLGVDSKHNFTTIDVHYGIDTCGSADLFFDPKFFNNNILELSELKELIGYKPNVERAMQAVDKGIANSSLNKPTPEILLEECKKMYKKGMEVVFGCQFTIDTENFYIEDGHIIFKNKDNIEFWITGNSRKDGSIIFAEIVSQPQPEQREILGYESPIDMFGGKVKKEMKWVRCIDGMYRLYDRYNGTKDFESYELPSEIVEAYFTPIYAKTEAEIQAEMWEEVMYNIQESNHTPSQLSAKFTIKRKGES